MSRCPAHLNPFRAARTDALAYRPQGCTWGDLMARLEAMGRRGAIVGPHGSGKTTLIQSLIGRLERRGLAVHSARLTQAKPSLDVMWWKQLRRAGDATVIIVDGSERLSTFAWWKLRYHARRAWGLIITTHKAGRLPTWVATRTGPALLGELVEELCPTAAIDTAAIYEQSRGNLRTALRDCYEAMCGQRA